MNGNPGGASDAPPNGLLDKVRRCSSVPQALKLALLHLEADTGTLHVLGDDGLLHLSARVGHIPDQLLPFIQTIPVGKGIAGLAVERKAPVNLCNLQTDTSGQARPRAKETGVKGTICVPLLKGGEAVGALGIGTHEDREFTQDETDILIEVGKLLVDKGLTSRTDKSLQE